MAALCLAACGSSDSASPAVGNEPIRPAPTAAATTAEPVTTPAEPVTTPAEPVTTPTTIAPARLALTSIAVLGDSMSAGLAAPLRAALESGACHMEWRWCIGFLIPSSAVVWAEILTEDTPDVVVLFFAPWENEALQEGTVIDPTDPDWPAIYRRVHVEPWVEVARASGSRVVWVSMPLSREPLLSSQHQEFNNIWAEVVANEPSMFWVDGAEILAMPDGSFTEIDNSVEPPVRLINLDGMHICPPAAERIADAVLTVLASQFRIEVQPGWRDSGWETYPEAFGPGCPAPT